MNTRVEVGVYCNFTVTVFFFSLENNVPSKKAVILPSIAIRTSYNIQIVNLVYISNLNGNTLHLK